LEEVVRIDSLDLAISIERTSQLPLSAFAQHPQWTQAIPPRGFAVFLRFSCESA
jgi:hypothetical protein